MMFGPWPKGQEPEQPKAVLLQRADWPLPPDLHRFRRLIKLQTQEWWAHRLDNEAMALIVAHGRKLGLRLGRDEAIGNQLSAQQWIGLHTTCNGRPPWRDAKIHIYSTLVCRGCGGRLQWSDNFAATTPDRVRVSL